MSNQVLRNGIYQEKVRVEGVTGYVNGYNEDANLIIQLPILKGS